MAIELGSVVDGCVTGISKFGAFVQLPDGSTGLVHISEVADSYVKDISEHLKVRDNVRVKVIDTSVSGKIGLSIKQAIPTPPPIYDEKPQQFSGEAFEDKLSRFMKDSNEKLVALKRHQEGGRKGRKS